MEKETEAVVATREPKAPGRKLSPQIPQPTAMTLEKAKKLIRKTSAEHAGLFRRLAK